MKLYKTKRIFCSMLVLFLAGCSSQENKMPQNSATVDKVLQEQVENAKDTDQLKSKENENNIAKLVDSLKSADQGVDYDLTSMSGDMVYAVVYQLMVNPKEYVGKTIKMRGNYYATYFEPTEKFYHYTMIEDAAACCAQGIEFVWDDGSHVYPEEYPKDKTEIEVVGVFETYREGGDTNLYCRLKDATLQVVVE